MTIAYIVTGTHRGDFLGVPVTGRRISARGVQIARFENGQIVERWGSSDQLGILCEIGVSRPQRGKGRCNLVRVLHEWAEQAPPTRSLAASSR